MTRRVGLIGWPVEYSVSPAMHNAAFAALGLDWRYDALPVPPDQFDRRLAEILAEGYQGLNVTVPHKQAALKHPLVTKVDPDADAIGAANTLTLLPGGKLWAGNTDWRGFAGDLAGHGIQTEQQSCLIFGTGGASRAVAYALRENGAQGVAVVSRSSNNRPDVLSYADLAELTREPGLIVNCTPVGMYPHVEMSPWPESIPFPRRAVLYDLVYNPPVTRLMQQAESAGARAIGGLGMLVRQGALSFERWTNVAPPREVMERAARESLKLRRC